MQQKKKSWLAKGSAAVALLLSASLALPVFAFAQSYIYKATYNRQTGTVTASVYTDETVTGSVYLNLMDPNMNVIDSVYLSDPSGKYGDTAYDRYDFSTTVTSNVYDRLKLTSLYEKDDSTVTSDVYEVVAQPVSITDPPKNNTGYGGGGGYIPAPEKPGDDAKVTAKADGTVSAQELADKLAESDAVTVELEGSYVLLPASVLAAATDKAVLWIGQDGVSLALPLAALNYEQLATQTSTDLDDLLIRVEISKLDGEDLRSIEAAAERMQAELQSDAVSFEVSAVGTDRTVEVNDFGDVYVHRTLPVNVGASGSSLSGVLFDPAANEFVFVPTELTYDNNGFVTAAVLKRPGNSVYAVIKHVRTFADIKNHWAAKDIERMAGKLLVEGVDASRFEPDRSITRAEFATLLVRALGLAGNGPDRGSNATFSDVGTGDWYADTVYTAAAADLVNGYPDGTFQPNDTITRAEMSAMIVRAMEFTGGTDPLAVLTPDQIQSALATYQDQNQLDWARTYVAVTVREGIIQGMTETTLDPHSNATRAQAAVMLERWLSSIKFI